MRHTIIDGERILLPETPQEMDKAIATGHPFSPPDHLARAHGLHGRTEDVGTLDEIRAAAHDPTL